MKRLIIAILVLLWAQAAAAQQTSRFFDGNYRYTISSFNITANTPDGADSHHMTISGGGGGTYDSTRGASVQVYGNEAGGLPSLSGFALITSGDTGNVDLIGKGAASQVRFKTDNLLTWHMDPGAFTTSHLLFGNKEADQEGYIFADTTDGVDDAMLIVGGGGGPTTGRGAFLQLYGNEHVGGIGGNANLYTGGTGDITLDVSGNGNFYIQTAGTQQVQIPYPTGAHATDIYLGDGSTAQYTTIRHISADGSDGQILRLCAGGACGNTRGGDIYLHGADQGGAGTGGEVGIHAADDGDINIVTYNAGDIQLTNGAHMWSAFGATGAGACTIASGKYANLKIDTVSVKVAICD